MKQQRHFHENQIQPLCSNDSERTRIRTNPPKWFLSCCFHLGDMHEQYEKNKGPTQLQPLRATNWQHKNTITDLLFTFRFCVQKSKRSVSVSSASNRELMVCVCVSLEMNSWNHHKKWCAIGEIIFSALSTANIMQNNMNKRLFI